MKTAQGSLTVKAARSPHVAAGLSFLWPGLGHWYGGRVRSAALFALPVVGIAALLLAQALGGLGHLAALLLTPSSALTVLILIGLLGAWRLLAIADSMSVPGTSRPLRRPSTLATFGVLALAVIATHGALGYAAWAFYDAGSRIFVGEQGPDETAAPSLVPGETPSPDEEYQASPIATPDEEYQASPIATPETAQSRINILLTGIDSAPTRTTALTDTLLVASVDPMTGAVALISFPRDISGFPLYDGRTYRGKINSFMTWARTHPKEFPDGPLTSLVKEMGFLLGAPIHYYAAIDLAGFRRMIDLVDGVTVDNPRAIDGQSGFKLSAGTHRLDGRTALAYVRSRQGLGDSDFSRARRQQQVLLALRTKLTSAAMLPKLPDIVGAAGDTIRTNFPSDRVGEMIDLAQRVDTGSITQVVLGPSKYAFHPPNSETDGIYTLRLKMDKLAELSIQIFGDKSAYAASQ